MSKYDKYKIIKLSVFGIFLMIIVVYAFFNARTYADGPQLIIKNPENSVGVSDSPIFYIEGEAFNISFININNRQINTDEKGAFKEAIILYPGYNTAYIQVKDKFDRIVEKKIEVVYKET